MSYSAPVIGYMDRLGYLTCIPCSIKLEKQQGARVSGDNSGFYGEPCDKCGSIFVKTLRDPESAPLP